MRRILHIHSLLANGQTVRVKDLAEKLEVSERTIKRDLETLRYEHGADISWDPSTGTYFCEHPSEQLPLLRITADEAIAVALANKTFAAWGGSALGQALESALGKISKVVGNAISLPVEGALQDIFHPGSQDEETGARHHFAKLLQAIQRRQAIRLQYRKPGSTSPEERFLHPLTLAFLEHEWLLVAQDPKKDGLRNFLLARIETVALTSHSFQKPKDICIRQHLSAGFGRYLGSNVQQVKVRFDTYAAPYIKERRWHGSQQIEDQPDGSLLVSFQLSHLLDVQRWILSWGSHAEALEPEDLRTSIAKEVTTLLDAYQSRQCAVQCPGSSGRLPSETGSKYLSTTPHQQNQ